jgi:hypothetical protein
MRTVTRTIACFALAAFSAMALDKEFVDQMMQSAKNIERDASIVSVALKTKKLDAEDVRSKIDAMGADLARLQELVARFESANPQLSERDRAEWQLIKDKVQLLEIFHGEKKKLSSADVAKNRGLLRAHADGVAMRAQKLQQTVAKMQRAPLS